MEGHWSDNSRAGQFILPNTLDSVWPEWTSVSNTDRPYVPTERQTESGTIRVQRYGAGLSTADNHQAIVTTV